MLPMCNRHLLALVIVAASTIWIGPIVLQAPLQADESKIESAITPADREHWAFRPLARPEVPQVANTAWPRREIDRFILAALEKKRLTPQPEADRVALIRRLSFDLVGLPPTPDDISFFVADESPDAYERLVDRLLASPAYGERMAQLWLDLARFAETDGFEFDKTRPEAWKYRDWVVEALNRDVPYDQFVQLQLAGDELAPGDPAAAVATAFCLSGPDMPDVNSQEERRHHLLNEMTGTVGSVLLGLQVGCAACHDHKYDPLSQADFYRLRAIFEPAVAVEKDKSVSVLREGGKKPEVSRVWLRGDFRRPGGEISPAFPRIANPWNDLLPPAEPDAKSTGRRAALARWITRPDHPLALRVAVNRIWQHHFGHGLSRTPNDFGVMGMTPSHADLLDYLAGEFVRLGWSQMELHRQIVLSAVYRQASRPARGMDLQAVPVRGPRSEQVGPEVQPTTEQPIAAEASWQASLAADPDNELLARFPRRRLEGETIRDAMLAAAGSLSTHRGGPGVMPPLPKELVETLLKDQWKPSGNPEDAARRSLYIFARRNLRFPIFESFDRPDANASCARRNLSTTAPQSLLMLNSEFSLAMSQRLAGLAMTDSRGDQPHFVTAVFRRALGRDPTGKELEFSLAFLKRQRDLLVNERRPTDKLALPVPCLSDHESYAAAALVDLCLALFNTSEFIYVD